MAIIVKINSGLEFAAEFEQWPQRRSHFSRPALHALYEFLDEASNGLGEDIELDVVGLCCEWAEYKNLAELCEDYSEHFYNTRFDLVTVATEEACLTSCIDDLRDQTTVIEFAGGLLVEQF